MQQQTFLEVDPHTRRPLDFYETPEWMTLALLRRLPLPFGTTVFECCAGDLAIADPLRDAGLCVPTNDLDSNCPAVIHGDATRASAKGGEVVTESALRGGG